MERLTFDDLLAIYRKTAFHVSTDAERADPAAEITGDLTVETGAILATLARIESDDQAARDSNIHLEHEIANVRVGDVVPVAMKSPRLALGVLARDLDDLLRTRKARICRPPRYFIVSGRSEASDAHPPPLIARYGLVLELVGVLAEAAFLDRDDQCLLFLDGGRIRVPVNYHQGDLEGLDLDALTALLGLFQSDLHRDERLSILARSAREMMAPHPAPARFRHLLAHLEDLEARVRDGYRLFAAAFSYDRIRSQMEKEAADTVARIHKTVTDIQGQMLGIPVATVIAATQMKPATGCGAVALGNLAVLVGVVIFAVLLFVALRNQWLTLETIANDVSRQTERMNKEHADIRRQFADLYEKVEDRLSWHRWVLGILAGIAVAGLVLAIWAFAVLTPIDMGTCLAGALSG